MIILDKTRGTAKPLLTRFKLLTSREYKDIRDLRREKCDLRRANKILMAASVCFADYLDATRPTRARSSVRTDIGVRVLQLPAQTRKWLRRVAGHGVSSLRPHRLGVYE